MVLLEHAGDLAHHQDRAVLARLIDLHGLEARVSAGSFSMCFLYSAQVVAAIVRKQYLAAKRRLEEVGRIARARSCLRRR